MTIRYSSVGKNVMSKITEALARYSERVDIRHLGRRQARCTESYWMVDNAELFRVENHLRSAVKICRYARLKVKNKAKYRQAEYGALLNHKCLRVQLSYDQFAVERTLPLTPAQRRVTMLLSRRREFYGCLNDKNGDEIKMVGLNEFVNGT